MPPSAPDAEATSPTIPRTPSHGSARADSAHDAQSQTTATSPSPRSSKKTTFALDNAGAGTGTGNATGPPQPFLAYARRIRSFSSSLKLNKTRYLLSFADDRAAQEWWELMKEEYPDTTRESPQLFAFRGDKVPARAWENPRFAGLKGRWGWKVLEDGEKEARDRDGGADGGDGEREGKRGRRGLLRRPTLGKTPSMPALRTIGETTGGGLQGLGERQELEDPFVTPVPAEASISSVKAHDGRFEDLTNALDRVQRMLEQTSDQLQNLMREHRASVESVDELRHQVQQNAYHIASLTERHEAGAVSTKNMRSSIELNATHIKTTMDRQDAGFTSLQKLIEETAGSVKDLSDTQKARDEGLGRLQDIVQEIAGHIGALVKTQQSSEDRVASTHKALEQNTAYIKAIAEKPQPQAQGGVASAGSTQKMQAAMEQNSTHLKGIADAQKVGNKQMNKINAALEKQAHGQDEAVRQIKSFGETQNKLTEQVVDALERQREASARQQESFEKAVKGMMEMMERQPKVECTHDVMPPPRKVGRKLVGYVYSRPE
ncbi:hypothetical protein M8818_005284 [Zalaria obscura]|uniref:Uncharacterized protein n=1 Tax=Zalaria obscura TaxID=2024903 RepID=A0ACC3SA87_9PEZI